MRRSFLSRVAPRGASRREDPEILEPTRPVVAGAGSEQLERVDPARREKDEDAPRYHDGVLLAPGQKPGDPDPSRWDGGRIPWDVEWDAAQIRILTLPGPARCPTDTHLTSSA